MGPPLLSVCNHPCPVGDVPQVSTNEVTLMKGCSSGLSVPTTGPAPQQVSLGATGWHSPDMAKLLKVSLIKLILH